MLALDTGWIIGFTIGGVVVAAVVVLVVTILVLAHSIGKRAAVINDRLKDVVHNTDALKELNTTIAAAGAITAGLNRGRKRLGG
jgi:hypothetical protein